MVCEGRVKMYCFLGLRRFFCVFSCIVVDAILLKVCPLYSIKIITIIQNFIILH